METITCGTWTGHLGKGLAPRELEALLGVAQGMTAKQIDQQMQITPGTVANRIENAMFKLGVAVEQLPWPKQCDGRSSARYA